MDNIIISCNACGSKNRTLKNKLGALCAKCKTPLVNPTLVDATFRNEPRKKVIKRQINPAFKIKSVIFILFMGYLFGPGILEEIGLCLSEEFWQCSTQNDQESRAQKVINEEISPTKKLADDFRTLPNADRKKIQYALSELGFYDGVIDGLWGANTKNALSEYDLSKNTNLSLRRIANSLYREVTIPEYIGLEGYPPPEEITTQLLYLADNYSGIAPFNISVASDKNFYVKLRRINDSTDVMTILVKRGDTFIGKAPLGVFELVYASGNNWYGEDLIFGPSTQYQQSDNDFVFRKEGRTIKGKTITLKPVRDGNMRTRKVSADQF